MLDKVVIRRPPGVHTSNDDDASIISTVVARRHPYLPHMMYARDLI